MAVEPQLVQTITPPYDTRLCDGCVCVLISHSRHKFIRWYKFDAMKSLAMQYTYIYIYMGGPCRLPKPTPRGHPPRNPVEKGMLLPPNGRGVDKGAPGGSGPKLPHPRGFGHTMS